MHKNIYRQTILNLSIKNTFESIGSKNTLINAKLNLLNIFL